VVDIMLVYGLVFWDRSQTVVAWLAMLALQMLTALVAFRLDGESLRPILKLPLQQFAYRQLMYLVLIQSAMTAMTGGRLRWHKLHRAGLVGSVRSTQDGDRPLSDQNRPPDGTPAPAHAEATALTEPTAEQPLVKPRPGSTPDGTPAAVRSANTGRAKVPGQGVAPALDSWPSILSRPPVQHPAAGRATARPATGAVPGQATTANHGTRWTADDAVRDDAEQPVLDLTGSGPAGAGTPDEARDGAARDLPPLDENAVRQR
jgi:hypothetical protein